MTDRDEALQSLQTLGQEADSMEVKPLPCPFCGGEATFRDFVEESVQTSKDYHKTKLCCENDRCEIQPETVDMVIREDSNEDIHGQLIKDWNTRA